MASKTALKSAGLLFIILCLAAILPGCGPGDSEGFSDERFPIEENDCDSGQSGENNVEEKTIEEIEDSMDITERAIQKAITEQQVMVSQEEFEQAINYEEALETEPDIAMQEENPEEIIEVEVFEAEIPDGLTIDLKYDEYPSGYSYALIMTNTLNVRAEPAIEDNIINKVYYFEKVNLEAIVKGQYLDKYETDLWYRILWKDGENIREGFVFSALAEARTYQFDKMYEKVKLLKEELDANTSAYISNYKNINGRAPLFNGKVEDEFGTARSQSAPAYYDLDDKSGFRYLEDGTLLTVFGENDSKTHYNVRTMEEGLELWVPKKYVSFRNSIEELTQVVVVDRKNQNEGVFEFVDGNWRLISYIFATTGEEAKYKMPTSLGYWMAIGTQPQFIYLDDITKEVAGYAPYTIRFNAGAYIHGVPVNYSIVNGAKVDPGKKEYLFTIGTVPRSHKCVRNYTSHAKFLYDWIEIGKAAVIVIE
ncbi:MAG TPA: L,D-transpeptidase family protein [Clostridia bacterium]|nr:L,D-transpeptidase family protein [Clostridia bacterium]